jgi:hypothetical protein
MQLGPQLDPGFGAAPANPAAFYDNLNQATHLIQQGQQSEQQLDTLLGSTNLTQYLYGCGIDVSQALSLCANLTNAATLATQAAVAAFAAAGCNIPPSFQLLITAAQNAQPQWENVGGAPYGTVVSTGSGGGTCLDTQEYLPSIKAMLAAASALVAALPAAVQACLATKDMAHQGGVVRHTGPFHTTGPVVPGVTHNQIFQLTKQP